MPSGGSREIETTSGLTDTSGRTDRDTTSIEAGIKASASGGAFGCQFSVEASISTKSERESIINCSQTVNKGKKIKNTYSMGGTYWQEIIEYTMNDGIKW